MSKGLWKAVLTDRKGNVSISDLSGLGNDVVMIRCVKHIETLPTDGLYSWTEYGMRFVEDHYAYTGISYRTKTAFAKYLYTRL